MNNNNSALLSIKDVHVSYSCRHGNLKAVKGVTLELFQGESLCLVGESGCGKTTLARAILRLEPLEAGTVNFDGQDLGLLTKRRLRKIRPKMQMIFQNPKGSLNPFRTVESCLKAAISASGAHSAKEIKTRVVKILLEVGLDPESVKGCRPGQLSGGQCQRVSIARALLAEPELLVCDEPVSSLDVTVQVQIIDLLARMRKRNRLTMLFISHDLSVVKHVSDRVAVMYKGKLCELGSTASIYASPAHPYTVALLAAIPTISGRGKAVYKNIFRSEISSHLEPSPGCEFKARCHRASSLCTSQEPKLKQNSNDRFVACHHPLD